MPGGGGLLQLVAQGKQDLFLTGNPQITWFKMVYRRYTNFAMESQTIYFDGDPDFGKRLTTVVPRRGDLLGALILEITLPQVTFTDGTAASYINNVGYAMIEEISLEIGEQEIDKQTGEWMKIWSDLTLPPGQKDGFYAMVGATDGTVDPPANLPVATCSTGTTVYGAKKLYIPLQFWFNKNPGLYLPLLAMQYHPIRINLKLRGLADLVQQSITSSGCAPSQVNNSKIVDLRLYGDYVYLDTEERRRFVANTHEYLIEQIQYTPKVSLPKDVNMHNVRLEFNHPVREMIWRIQRDLMETTKEWFNYSSKSAQEAGQEQHMLESALIQVDGFDRFEVRDAGYFSLVQPYQYHTNIAVKGYFYSYSFSLRPEEMQPSGSLNASRIDNLVLQVNTRPDTNVEYYLPGTTTRNPAFDVNKAPNRGNANIRVYAKNHNVLRVVNGFAGLLFKI